MKTLVPKFYSKTFCLLSALLFAFSLASLATDRYVSALTGNDVNPGTIGAPWKTIQHANDASVSGDIVHVLAGFYPENVSVTKTLTFLGPNDAISPNGGARVSEAVVVGAGVGSTAFQAATSGTTVIIKGFSMIGNSPMDDGNLPRDGGNPENISVTFEKNIVTSGTNLFAGSNTRWLNVTITDNLFQNINLTASSSAIQLNDARPSAPTLTAIITNNVISTTNFAGILIDNALSATVTGNKISNVSDAGIQVAGGNGMSTSVVQNNEINNANYSSQVDNGAIRLYGVAGGGSENFNGAADVSANIVTNTRNGFAAVNGANLAKGVSVYRNSFNLTQAIYNGPSNGILDATCNWYGTICKTEIAAKISGPVTFIPYLIDGTDNSTSTTGFQNSSTCLTPLNITITLESQTNSSCGSNNGAIDISVSGGSDPGNYTYSWTNGATTQDISGLAAGPYTVTVKDKYCVVATATYTIINGPDNTPPTITCPATVNATTNTNCTATGVVLGTPTGSDNCGTVTFSNDHPSTTYNLGTTNVTWTADDGHGNTATCVQQVIVTDNVKPTITCPATVNATTNSGCSATGVVLGTPTGSDNCGTVTFSNDHPSTTYDLGTTNVTWTANDGHGNTATCVQQVIVTDNVKPTITCPATVNATTNSGCSATGVVLGTPTGSDNCGTVTFSNDHPSTTYDLGTTNVTWTANDGHGNTATCVQQVIVTDNVKPTITCPATVNATTNTNCTATGVVLGTPTGSDNCGTVTFSNDHPSTTYDLGTTNVTWTANDGHGNTATCVQQVIVTDNVKPTITCPATVNATTNSSSCTATGVVLGTPTGSDNCGTVTFSNNHTSTTYPLGTTVVTWTANDGHGNTATCTQNVIVTDNVKPTITCPTDVNMNSNSAGCTATGVVLGTPTGSDNCGTVTFSNNHPSTTYPQGTTVVTWTADDGHGNTATCTQNVTITCSNPYLIYGYKHVEFSENNHVNGNSGVKGTDPCTATPGHPCPAVGGDDNLGEVKKGTVIPAPFFIKAPVLKIDPGASVNSAIIGRALPEPTEIFYPYNGSTVGLTDITVTTNGTVVHNHKKVTIKKNISATLDGDNYGDITMEAGATVTFTGGVINILSLTLQGDNSLITRILFSTCSAVKIGANSKIGNNCIVNATNGPNVNFYVGDNNVDDEEFMVDGLNSVLTVNIFVKEGLLHVHGDNSTFNGWVIAEDVDGDAKNVTWNPYTKAGCTVPVPPAAPIANRGNMQGEETNETGAVKAPSPIEEITTVKSLTVKVLPNPTDQFFTVALQSPSKEPVQVIVYDSYGKRIEQLSGKVDQRYQIGDHYNAGTYLMIVQQGAKQITTKLIKQ